MSIEYQPAPKTHGDIWAALHLPSRGKKLHEGAHKGLPFELLDQIATLVQMPCGYLQCYLRVVHDVGAKGKNWPFQHCRKRSLGDVDSCV